MRAVICLLVSTLCTINCYSQNNFSKSATFYKHTTQALVLYLSVEYNVEKILSKKTASSQGLYIGFEKFKSRYSKAYSNIKTSIGSSEEFNEVVKLLPLNKIDEYYEQFPINESTTQNYITRLEGYLSGNSTEEAFRSLLIFQYLEKPADEFRDGFTSLFNTANHSKSKGTKWTIRFPKSWKLSESDRPNTICKIVNEADSLLSLTMVVLRVDALQQPVLDYSSLGFAKAIVPREANIIEHKKRNIENCPSGSIEYLLSQPESNNEVTSRVIHYYFVFNKQLYTLYAGCTMNDKRHLEKIWQKNLPLFELMANSIVLLDKYQQ